MRARRFDLMDFYCYCYHFINKFIEECDVVDDNSGIKCAVILLRLLFFSSASRQIFARS